MDNKKKYNLFILFSTIARNIAEVFSSIILYKMGYSLKEILLFYAVLYFIGAFTSWGVIYLMKRLKPKYILIVSSLIFSGSFYFMSVMEKNFINLIILGIVNGIGAYTYHVLRHYYAIKSIDGQERKEIGNILIYTNIAIIISSYVGSYIQDKLSVLALAIVIVVISIIAIIPIFKFEEKEDRDIIRYDKIPKNKVLFFFLEQAKVINLSLQPLFLYLFIDDKITYVGIFNVIMGVSACIFIYLFVRKIDDKKYFKYLNMVFCLFLILKLNISNKYLLLFIAFFEGLGVKMFEIVSSENIYDISSESSVKGYLIIVEAIFCLVRCLMCLIGYFINDIIVILYITIILILGSGFVKRKNVK